MVGILTDWTGLGHFKGLQELETNTKHNIITGN
jgi:hypothetical protein